MALNLSCFHFYFYTINRLLREEGFVDVKEKRN